MQMLLSTVLIDPAHPALEHREIAFDGVGVDAALADILAFAVDGGAVAGE